MCITVCAELEVACEFHYCCGVVVVVVVVGSSLDKWLLDGMDIKMVIQSAYHQITVSLSSHHSHGMFAAFLLYVCVRVCEGFTDCSPS